MTPSVPVSWGELIDKLTILEIKSERLRSEPARANVRREYELLAAIAARGAAEPNLAPLKGALKVVNEKLWAIEDDIRAKEAAKSFDHEFIRLARAVYHSNDERGRLKRAIDALLGSEIVEEKQYPAY
jgi:Family of unknown function (DUF6165)